MPVKSVRAYALALLLSDIIAILGAFTIAYIVRVQIDSRPLISNISAIDFVSVFLLLIPFWILVFGSLGLYRPDVYQKRMREMRKLFIGSFIGILLVIGFAFVSEKPIFPARLVAVYAACITFVLLFIGREVLRRMRKVAFRYGKGIQRVMIIGSGETASNIIASLEDTKTSGFNIVATCGTSESATAIKRFRSLESALGELQELDIDTIVQTEIFKDESHNRLVFEHALNNHVGYSFVPAEIEFYSGKNTVDVLDGYPIISVSQTPLSGWGEVIKRLFDIFGACVGLILSLPIFLVVGAIIKLTDNGPIIYRHKRISRHGKVFWVYKLRSMYLKYSTGKAATGKSDEDIFKEMGREDLIEEFRRTQKVKKDPRIMPIGRFTRTTSLDELPQLLNVLKGELSLVGPRPIVKDELKHYKKSGAVFLSVKPGLTGLWQVSGRSDLDYEDRVNLDIYYVQNWNFWLDLKILFKTIGVIINKTGAK